MNPETRKDFAANVGIDVRHATLGRRRCRPGRVGVLSSRGADPEHI